MKRKMIGAAASYMAGLFFASFFTAKALLLIFLAMIAAALYIARRYGFKKADYFIMTAFFIAAASVFQIYSAVRYAPAVAMDGKSGSFCGEVTEVVRYDRESSSYILDGKINGDISAKVSFYSSSSEAEYGDVISIESCVFSRPSKDYLFDSERYYKSDGVFLTIESHEGVSVEKSSSHSLRKRIMEYRENIISDFCISLGADSGDFLAGMVFGEKRGMDENMKTAVYRSGIGHMLAVSGLHISIAVLVLMSLLSFCHVNKFAAFALMELLLVFLTAMANYPVSAMRAAIMMNFLYAARLFRRQNDSFNSLSAAVLLICIFQPYVIYDEGFILSVAGTFGIGVFAPYMTKDMPRERAYQRLLYNIAVMLCTSLCVFPFSLMYFDETSLVSPITNVVIVPLCSVSMVAGLIYGLTGGILDLLPVSKAINEFVLTASHKLANIRATHFSCDSKALIGGLMICTFITICGAALFRSRKIISASAAFSLVFLFLSSGAERIINSSQLTIAVLGKGNNAAVVVSRDGSADIIDLSGHYRSAAYVRKYLMRNGIDSVDVAVITKNVQSGFASYGNKMEFVDIGKWLIGGDNHILFSTNETLLYFNDEVTIDRSDHSIDFYRGCLTVSSENGSIVFSDGSSENISETGVTVYYGKAPKNKPADSEAVILLDDENNFELVLSKNGSYTIRRL